MFSHDGTSLLTTDVQGDTRIWSTQTCQEQTQLIGQLSRVVSADFSPDDQYVVTAGSDRTARIFSLPDGTLQATLLGHSEALKASRTALTGRRSSRPRSTALPRVWDARHRPSGSAALGTHRGAAGAVAVSPERTRSRASGPMATFGCGARDAPAALDPRRRRTRRRRVQRDGKLVAAAGADGTTRIWNVATLAARHPVLAVRTCACARAVARWQVARHGRHRQRGPRLRAERRAAPDYPDQHRPL